MCLLPTAANADNLRLAWDPSPDAVGYVVRWGVEKGTYPSFADAGNTTAFDVSGLTGGVTYWAVVEAYDAQGQRSLPSNPLAFTVPCSYAITPAAINIYAPVADGTLYVSTQPGCAWSAVSSSAFVSFQNGAARVGPGPLPFTVAENTAEARSGSASVAGHTFTVTQAAPIPCTIALSQTSFSLGNAPAAGTITVTTGPTCLWSASSDAPFLSFLDGANRTGTATVTFSATGNLTATPRSASVSIGDEVLTFTQAANPEPLAAAQREAARSDFDGDGRADLLWQDVDGGNLDAWMLDGHTVKTSAALAYRIQNNDWRIVGTGDFNGDSKPDIVWQHYTEGWVYLWYMDGLTRIGDTYFSMVRMPSAGWRVAGVGDFNGDSKPDLIFQHPTERWVSAWLIDGIQVTNVPLSPSRLFDPNWLMAGTGDFNGDGKSDILWRHSQSGELGAWMMDGLVRTSFVSMQPGRVLDGAWQIAAVIDANGDNMPDIVWQHSTQGWSAVWFMDGLTRTAVESFAISRTPNWKIAAPK